MEPAKVFLNRLHQKGQIEEPAKILKRRMKTTRDRNIFGFLRLAWLLNLTVLQSQYVRHLAQIFQKLLKLLNIGASQIAKLDILESLVT